MGTRWRTERSGIGPLLHQHLRGPNRMRASCSKSKILRDNADSKRAGHNSAPAKRRRKKKAILMDQPLIRGFAGRGDADVNQTLFSFFVASSCRQVVSLLTIVLWVEVQSSSWMESLDAFPEVLVPNPLVFYPFGILLPFLIIGVGNVSLNFFTIFIERETSWNIGYYKTSITLIAPITSCPSIFFQKWKI